MTDTIFINLAESASGRTSERCDICIVGAGAAGIYLAVELASRSLDVVLLEAGDLTSVDASTLFGADPIFDAEHYPGATVGRYFGIGGTTSRWGGLLIPHTQHDLNPINGDIDPWTDIVKVVKKKSAVVLKKLGWEYGDDFSDFARQKLNWSSKTIASTGLEVSSSLFLPFRKKNFSHLLKRKLGRGCRLRVFYNAVVNKFLANHENSNIRFHRAKAISRNGNPLIISASRYIIAAGAIESARILLELDQSSIRPMIRAGSVPGRFLADHLSLAIADVDKDSIQETINKFAPCFNNGWMRSFRFSEMYRPDHAPRAFAHFMFDNQNPGFALAKEFLGALQGRRLPSITASDVFSGIGGIVQLGYCRYARSVLYVPPGSNIHLQLDVEQTPVKENGITLGNHLDRYGRHIARIYWSVNTRDIDNIRETADRLLKKWSIKTSFLPKLRPLDLSSSADKPHDAYHPAGTCRLGRDDEAVVDENLKVWGLNNMWVVSTGVLPSAGTANPTFTMLCLADELIDHLLSNDKG